MWLLSLVLIFSGILTGVPSTPVPTPMPTPNPSSSALPSGCWAVFSTDTTDFLTAMQANETSCSVVISSIWSGNFSGTIPQSNTMALFDCVNKGYSICGSPVANCALDSPLPGWCDEDTENWTSTPPFEYNDIVGQTYAFCQAVNAAGQNCIMSSDGPAMGLVPSSCSFNVLNSTYIENRAFPWKLLKGWEIQGQTLADDTNCGSGNVAVYISFLQTVIPIALAGNPNLKLMIDCSLRDSTASTCHTLLLDLRGFPNIQWMKIACPTNGQANCNSTNLNTILGDIKNQS